MKDINEVMLNPIRMRVIQELSVKGSMTTSELCEKIRDIPKTTMYRHVNILLDSNILSIVSEKKVRGSLERTLTLNVGELSKHNTLENATQNVLAFLMNRYARFHSYFNGKNPEPARDRLFYNNTVLMMSDGEFDKFLTELRDILINYNFEATEERKVRDISIISTPAESKRVK